MAKTFHEVLQRIFAQTAIIPFRFPTILASEKELREFMKGRAAEYGSALDRLRNKVQMDVRIIIGASDGLETPLTKSGKTYLENKRARRHQGHSLVDEFRRVSASAAEGWIERETPSGARAFALVDRSSLPMFLEKIKQVLTPEGVSARVTGPWPPSEFVEIVQE